MASNQKFFEEFAAHTKVKLTLFKSYIDQWYGVFTANPSNEWPYALNIFDLFCGNGTDTAGNQGSPMLVLDSVIDVLLNQTRRAVWHNLYISDAEIKNVENVKNLYQEKIESQGLGKRINAEISCAKAEDQLRKYEKILNDVRYANLLLLDQFGWDTLDQSTFQNICRFKGRNDLLFFFPSSTANRFQTHKNLKDKPVLKEFRELKEDNEVTPHENTINLYRSWIPSDSGYKIYGFELKAKYSNSYSILFGTKHLKGTEVFLKSCWALDPMHGKKAKTHPEEDLFATPSLSSNSVQDFQKKLEQEIKSRKLKKESEIAHFCLEHGHLLTHATDTLKKLQKEKFITSKWNTPNIKSTYKPDEDREIIY